MRRRASKSKKERVSLEEYQELLKNQKSNKYSNENRIEGGIKFHSKKEAKRYQELKLLEKAGEIQNITLQVPFQLTSHETKICKYIADFIYLDHKEGKYIIEDVKGIRTAIFNLKWKLLKAQFGDKYIYRIT